MTFKHTKFQDSAVMRSLEKVAREKGLVKEESLVKNASAADFTPTSNLIVNLLKLSEGLRAKGFEKAAVELENKAIAYKQAQTLYETSKEKGDDLIDAAHPKGSHKLEDVDGDEATFETILDQHLQHLKMVEKNPTGKLASNDDVMDAVRLALGDSSFLGNGRKVAQDSETAAPAAPASGGSGVATDVAVSAGSMLLMQKAFDIVKNWRAGGVVKAYDASLVQLAKSQATNDAARKALDAALKGPNAARVLAKMTPTATAALQKEITKDVAEAAAKTTARTVGKGVAKEVGKGVAKEVGKGVAKEVGKEVAKDVAIQGAGAVAKSSGVWPRLVGLLGSAGSTAGAIGATEIGGGTLTGGVAGLAGAGAAGIAALSAAALIGAVAGSIGGYYLFEHYYRPTDLQEAGERLLSEAKDVEKDFPEYKHVIDFQRSLNAVIAKYATITKIKSGAPLTEESLNEIKEISELIMKTNKQASTIWGFAMGHKDDQWFGALRGFGDVVAAAANYMEVSMKMSDVFDGFARDLTSAIQKKIQETQNQEVASKGGASVVALQQSVASLQKSYTDAQAQIGEYVQKVKAKELANAPTLLTWLGKAKKAVDSESAKFASVPDVNKPALAKDYTQRFEKLKTKIKAFADKWMV